MSDQPYGQNGVARVRPGDSVETTVYINADHSGLYQYQLFCGEAEHSRDVAEMRTRGGRRPSVVVMRTRCARDVDERRPRCRRDADEMCPSRVSHRLDAPGVGREVPETWATS